MQYIAGSLRATKLMTIMRIVMILWSFGTSLWIPVVYRLLFLDVHNRVQSRGSRDPTKKSPTVNICGT